MPHDDDEHRSEAERLAQLSRTEQQKVLAMYQTDAGNPRVQKQDRECARRRVEALERHLRRLNRRKSPRKGL
jgi:hypothetical protein